MGARRRNGVEAAIALLEALADGPARPGELARRLGLARASLYRIVRELAAEGLLAQSRGRLALGSTVARFLDGYAARLSAELPMGQKVVPAVAPLVLTAPPVLTRRSRRLRIGFSNAGMDNLWRVALVHSVEHAAAELAAEIDWFAVRQAEGDAARQADDIVALLAAGVDGLLVSAVDAIASAQAVAAAMQRVPVVLVDRPVAAEVAVSATVTGDDHALGTTTALWLAETLKGNGRILLLPGRQDAEPARRRLAAAEAVFASFAGIERVGTAWSDWRRDRAFEAVSAVLAQDVALAGVWSDSGLQGAGSLQAFLAAGYRQGEIPPHTGGDLNLAYKLALRNRVRLAGVDYPPQMGARAMGLLHDLLRGRWVPREVTVPSGVTITRGHATRSVRPDQWADKHVRWDLPDDLVLGAGLGAAYDPRRFRIHYPGNRYNRSAARELRE